MSFWKRLFGGAARPPAATVEPVAYKGLRILPQPIPEGGQFRLCAVIEGEVDGQTRRHRLVRADLLRDHDEAFDASLRKAQQVIDQQGAAVLDTSGPTGAA